MNVIEWLNASPLKRETVVGHFVCGHMVTPAMHNDAKHTVLASYKPTFTKKNKIKLTAIALR